MLKIFEKKYEDAWDNLVLNESMNGNFLETRRFLNYHAEGRFIDHSLMFFKGEQLVAVIPANVADNGKMLISHSGSTYGGIIIAENFCSTTNYKWIFDELMNHIGEQGFERVEIRTSHWLYKRLDNSNELLDYFFQLNGFRSQSEIGFYMDLSKLDENYSAKFDSLKKRKLKKANKADLTFRELEGRAEIREFYEVLEDNMLKFDTTPVHSYEELLEFKESRLKDEVHFYGVYKDKRMIAGSMVFDFCNHKVFHTQYLCSRHDALDYCPNEFLYTNLLQEAIDEGYRFLSYGTSSLEHGKVYNESLGLYKEGYNTDTYMNINYILERDCLIMRDIKDYTEKYVEEPFESTMVKIRKSTVIEQCNKYNHKNILEIGCGMNPFFLDFKDYENMVIAEPGESFAVNAAELAKKEEGHIDVIQGFLEDIVDKIKKLHISFDFIILSSVLHELDNPQKMLEAIYQLCDDKTIVHINVPNANSLHRLIAIEAGLIKDVHEQSNQMKKMQRRRTYDMQLLKEEMNLAKLEVVDFGSYFIKPFTHMQMQRCLDDGIIDENVLEGLDKLVKYLPENGAGIFVNVRKE